MKILLITLMPLIFLFGCTQMSTFGHYTKEQNSNQVQKLRWLMSVDVKKDLEKAINQGDRRFMGTYGYAIITPGIADMELTKKYGIRCMEGTSDFIENEEHQKLIKLAEKYALRYNTLLLREINASPQK